MKAYETEQLRNVVLMGHVGSGKTTLAEAMLFASGATSRLGRVEDGNTVSDFDEQEHAHQYSISASLIPIEWNGSRINLIDTPGYPDFEAEVVSGCAAADAAIITVDAVSGVQAGTEVAWRRADEAGLPRMVLVTRLDRENADYDAVLEQLRERFGKSVVPVAIPIGASGGLEGAVDLLTQRARRGDQVSDPPPEIADAITAAREMMVESVAESDDDLLERYLDGKEIGEAELEHALHAGVADGSVVPVIPVCATREFGVRTLLDDIVRLFPSPADREREAGGESLKADPDGPLVVHVFKTLADPFVGHLTFMRVISGRLAPGASPYNVRSKQPERIGHVYLQRGKEQIEVPALVAGDIGVAAKLAHTATGDTLVASEADAGRVVAPVPFPVPTYRTALHPHSKDDVDKLSHALHRIMEQDPTIVMERDPDTAETILRTIGDAQVNITAARLAKTYGVTVDCTVPRVPYKETISAPAKAEYKHKKQTGGHGQYGHVVIQIEPLDRGAGFQFADSVVGGSVPRQYIPAVEKGVVESLPQGPLAHSPLVDVKVTLTDGSYHAVDSSEMAFKTAASQALRQGVLDAHPILLEPVMHLKVQIPSECVGDVMSDISGKRGHVHGVEPNGTTSLVEAEAPLSEVQRYATDLRALTGGRGRFELEFGRYVEVPPHVQQQVVAELQHLNGNGH